ncbi:MAG: alpha/beta hydrolase, partial [Ferruginibacter sp.]
IYVVLFSACKKSNTDVTPTIPTVLAASNSTNVSYGTSTLQKMDIYLPQGRSVTTTKVMVIVHGGGWYIGDKSEMQAFVDILKTRLPDYAFVNINYRLTTTTNGIAFPAHEQDVKAATDFIYNKRAEYNISDKFVMLGASAGAHLALLQAYKNTIPKVKAVVDLYGPTDMTDMYYNPASSLVQPSTIGFVVAGSIFGNPITNATTFNNGSPIKYVSAQSCPTIIFHGEADSLVKPSQSVSLSTKLNQFNVVNQLKLYPGEPHVYVGASLDDTINKTIAFLTANVL